MFAVPALVALVAGNNSLWARPVLIILVFPIAIVFAILGRHYPSAGGVAHFVGMAFGSPVEGRVTGWLFYRSFLWVYPPRYKLLPDSARQCLAGIAGNCCWQKPGYAGVGVVYRYSRCQFQCKSTNRYCRTYRRTDCRYLVGGRYQTCEYPLPLAPGNIELTGLFAALSVMFCVSSVSEAFAHLASEFEPESRLSLVL